MNALARSLKHQSAFASLYRKGRRLRGSCLTMCFLAKTTQDNLSFEWAAVASRKTGQAVDRNRFKRRLRELVRKHANHLVGLQAFSLIAKTPVKAFSYARLEEDLLKFLKQLKHGQ